MTTFDYIAFSALGLSAIGCFVSFLWALSWCFTDTEKERAKNWAWFIIVAPVVCLVHWVFKRAERRQLREWQKGNRR